MLHIAFTGGACSGDYGTYTLVGVLQIILFHLFCSERVKSERRAKRRESSQLLQKARSASKERAQVSAASIAEVPPTPQAASSETVEEVVSVSKRYNFS